MIGQRNKTDQYTYMNTENDEVDMALTLKAVRWHYEKSAIERFRSYTG